MQCVQSVFLSGRESKFVQVELIRYRGIPQIIVVGLAAKMVTEAKERLKSALKFLGVRLPQCHYVINLTPAGLIKKSTGLELAMMVAFLSELQLLSSKIKIHNKQLWIGELGLDGTVKPVTGIVELVIAAKLHGYQQVWCAQQSIGFLSLISGIDVHGIGHIGEVMTGWKPQINQYLRTVSHVLNVPVVDAKKLDSEKEWDSLQHAQVLKRAALIAAAGWHHLCLIGPPGFGKTTMAKLLVDLLPPPSGADSLSILRVASLQNAELSVQNISRPLCSPTNSISLHDLVGGGRQQRLGAVTLADRGVLFLDEFVDFPTKQLEALKAMIEFGAAMTGDATTVPARFLLVAAANPCRCGNLGSTSRTCTCLPHTGQLQFRKLSSAWFDRIDICIRVQPSQNVTQEQPEQSYLEAKQLVQMAWNKQKARWQDGFLNGMIYGANNISQLQLDHAATLLLEQAQFKLKLSERGLGKLKKVARTIEDLRLGDNGEQPIGVESVAEALQYRSQLIFS